MCIILTDVVIALFPTDGFDDRLSYEVQHIKNRDNTQAKV